MQVYRSRRSLQLQCLWSEWGSYGMAGAAVPDRRGTGGCSCKQAFPWHQCTHTKRGVNTFTAPPSILSPLQACVKACGDRPHWQRDSGTSASVCAQRCSRCIKMLQERSTNRCWCAKNSLHHKQGPFFLVEKYLNLPKLSKTLYPIIVNVV